MLEILRLELLESIQISREKRQWFRAFCQGMLHRIQAGELRYGPGSKRQKYMTRLIKEVKAYEKTGNAEQLFNIANYCILEWIYPEHPKHHFKPEADSVTRE